MRRHTNSPSAGVQATQSHQHGNFLEPYGKVIQQLAFAIKYHKDLIDTHVFKGHQSHITTWTAYVQAENDVPPPPVLAIVQQFFPIRVPLYTNNSAMKLGYKSAP